MSRPKSTSADGSAGQYDHLRTGRAAAALRGVFWASLSSFAPAVVAGVVFTVSSRVLDPSDFGIVALAASLAMFASAIAPAGFGGAVIQRHEIGKQHIDSVFWLCMVSAFVIYAGLFLAAPVLARLTQQAHLTPVLRVLGLRVVFDLACVVPNALLSRTMKFDKLATRTIVASFVAAGVCLVLLALGYGFWALAISQLASSVTTCVATLMAANWRPGIRLEWKALRDLSHYGLFASGTRIIHMVSVEQILIGSLLGAAPLGIFSFARRIFKLINDMIAGALNAVSYTVLASLQSEREKLREAYLLATFASATLSFPIFVGLGVVAPVMVPIIFGPHWLAAVPALQGFCVIGLLSCVGILQASLINSQGYANWWLYYLLGKQVATALVVLLFYPLGVSTLVFAIAVLTVFLWPVSVWMVLRILGIPLGRYFRPFLSPAVASAVMAAGVIWIQHAMTADPAVVRLAVEVGAGAAIYLLMLIILDARRILRMREAIVRRRAMAA